MCVCLTGTLAHEGALLTEPQAEEQPGFTDGLLNVLQQEQEPAIRLSSKNKNGRPLCAAAAWSADP